jgi:hypothetical protein
VTELDQQTIDRQALATARRMAARVRVFNHDEPGYENWLGGHPASYVVAVIGGDAMLHSARCNHIQPDGELLYTANLKVGSDSEDTLLKWAQPRYGDVPHCQHCG